MNRNWAPKTIVRALEVLYVIDTNDKQATAPLIQDKIGCSYGTMSRYLRVLKELFNVKLSVRQVTISFRKRPNYYAIDDWGMINPKNFREHFEQNLLPLIRGMDKTEGREEVDL